ncbi:uncharacterized protein PV09_07372 [Verruconis gallopava]|uniref:HMG box domain-containing protein n=1 Tax=Verruconis gallopava TaxID=253628 RepID=A0A0D1YJQ3_9PEZI|nr:uncharacterized protein PV09_07372 [Verruconis gallopava]KIW01082.1 hypothetical protein PV09_07372 [Verruconis gallopava]
MSRTAPIASLDESEPSASKTAGPVSSISLRPRSNRYIAEPGQTLNRDITAIDHQSQNLAASTSSFEAARSSPESMTRQHPALFPPESLSSHKNENTSRPSTTAEAVLDICLCQPDPKIPRPRNAFILYRQHHQQNIILQHRGLSNPEISKIAGQLWQAEPEEVKNTWKAFAEEEKARHAQQYPDYRFQPRHKNKIAPSSVQGEKARCPKCGGRSIVAKSLAFTPSLLHSKPNDCITYSPTLPAPQNSVFSSSHKLLGATSNSIASSNQRDSQVGTTGSPMARKFSDTAIEISDSKRRRYESYRAAIPARRSEVTHPANSNDQNTLSSNVMNLIPRVSDMKRASLPTSPEAKMSARHISTCHSTASSPPLTPHTTGPITGLPASMLPSGSGRNGLHSYPVTPITVHNHLSPRPLSPQAYHNSESLRLAPLLSPAAGEHRRSIEAMIMSIPVIGKLGQLRRIAPPIKEPSLGSPPYRIRGSIIAIEGDETCAAEAMLEQLEIALRRNDEFDIRTLPGPRAPGEHCKLKDYIDVVSVWHDETKKITDFITGVDYTRVEEIRVKDSVSDFSSMREQSNLSSADKLANRHIGDGGLSADARGDFYNAPFERHSCDHHSEEKTEAVAKTECEARRRSDVERLASKIPLLLIGNYILHGSNAWSTALPINDVYSPADHWAWTATLWRGVVGADLTVYVRTTDKERDEPMSANGARTHAAEKKVEIKDDVGAILVRREYGKVDDGAVRRVAFEIGELVRMQAGKQS